MTPSSLADAVMRELSDRAPELRSRSSNPPPIVEPSDLRPRSSKPPFTQAPDRELPSDGELSEMEEGDPFAAAAGLSDGELAGDQTEIDAPVGSPDDAMGALPEEEAREPIESASVLREDFSPSIPVEIDSVVSAPVGLREPPLRTPSPVGPAEPLRTPLSSVASRDPAPTERPPLRPRWPWVIAMALVGGGILVEALVARPSAGGPVAASNVPDLVQSLPLTSGVPVASESSGVSYEALPESLSVSSGQGLLEVSVGVSTPVRVDGVARGSGPLVRVPLTAGPHEIVVGMGERRTRSIEVRAGRTAHLDLSPTP